MQMDKLKYNSRAVRTCLCNESNWMGIHKNKIMTLCVNHIDETLLYNIKKYKKWMSINYR